MSEERIVNKPATDTFCGSYYIKCETCEYTEDGDYHTYVDGVCKDCGVPEPIKSDEEDDA